ncbi:hypothetical protein P154DRAFT_560809 [Amniculicola lignicola CBS 123094]|uniref:Uncharacterized protein n=1 Tax=Amniculicola lignicola CBS 123094 TaxID=1392246 RepID=A0A6A5WQ05_9PLEO|nr:hypothetical protein P154DRAFT_560809 [Amniculicola lignicola CBS 123094]
MQFTISSVILALATSIVALPAAVDIKEKRDDHTRASFCTDASRGGRCFNSFGLLPQQPGQGLHCWDLTDGSPTFPDLQDFQDSISSFYPEEDGAVWTLWENFGCGGATADISFPGVDDLSTIGFNDKASSLSVRFR